MANKTSEELANILWSIADELRGNMDSTKFKDYILGVIFYRYLSEKTVKYMNNILKNDGVTYEEALENSELAEAVKRMSIDHLGYIIEPKYLFSNLVSLIKESNFSIEDFEKAISSLIGSTIGQDSEQAFDKLFDDMNLQDKDLGKEVSDRTELISKVILKISNISFDFDDTEEDILGTAYMILIGLFQSDAGKKGGEFFTPAGPSQLCVELATLGLDEIRNCCDPCAGSGSMLLRVGKATKNSKNVHYYGQEFNGTTYNLLRMNMLMHGVPYKQFSMFNDDTIKKDNFYEDGKEVSFQVQVSNPPYSLKYSANKELLDDPRYSSSGELAPKSFADLMFLEHMVYHMANDGRIAVLLPLGVLTRGGSEDTIRKYLIRTLNCIDAVIGLPANLFHGTNTPVALILCKKNRNNNSDKIFICDASKEYKMLRNQNELTAEGIKKIVSAYSLREDVDKFCRDVPLTEISNEDNDYNLNISRYIDTYIPQSTVNIVKAKKELDDIVIKKEIESQKFVEYLNDLNITNQKTDKVLQAVFSGEVRFKDKNNNNYPEWKEKLLFSMTKFETSQSIDSKETGKYVVMDMGTVTKEGNKLDHKRTDDISGKLLLKKGDLVMPKDDIGAGLIICKTAYIDEDDKYVMGDHIYKLNFKDEDSEFMHYYINSDVVQKMLHRYVTNGSIKGVTSKSFKNVKLRIPCLEEQNKIKNLLKTIDNLIEYSRKESEAWANIQNSFMR